MSDFDQHKNDGARREGFTSSNGGRGKGQTSRPRFTREGHGGERSSYYNKSGYGNDKQGNAYNRGGYSYNERTPRGVQYQTGENRSEAYGHSGNYGREYRKTYGSADRRQGGYASEGYQRNYGNTSGYMRKQDGYNRPQYNRQPRYNQEGATDGFGHRQYGDNAYSRPSQGGFDRSRSGYKKRYDQRKFDAGKRRIDYKEEAYDPNQPIRLNKFLANAGVCSRRDADKYIEAGVVTVNGEIITELGHKVLRSDTVLFHEQLVKAEKKIYVLLNKPKGYVTTSEDPQNRKTVMDLVRNACMERIYPVGRLDRNTTGVLLLTNDGEMASKLTHPKFLKKKIYHVFLDRNVSASDLRQIAEGITLEDGDIQADAVDYASETDKKQVGIEIHSGKNRIVRRIFASLGYNVVKLDRVYFAGLTKKNVKRGDWRYLTEEEVRMLRMGAFE